MQYFYKKPYSGGVDAFSLGEASSSSDEANVVEAARQLGIDVVSVSSASHTVLLNLNGSEQTEIEKKIGLKLYPNFQYAPAVCVDDVSFFSPALTPADAAGPNKFSFLVEGTDGKAISNARVDVTLKHWKSAAAFSDADGRVEFSLCDPEILSIRVQPRENYWCAAPSGGKANSEPRKLIVERLELPFKDSLGCFHPTPSKIGGAGVKVAVIDTGVNRHVDLPKLSVERTFLLGDPSDGCEDNQQNHGTHVSGIIAGKRFGLAPKVELLGYSVFPKPGGLAGTIDIALAIDQAVADGADIINLSLGMDKHDPAIDAAIANAVDEGVFVVAATGNGGKALVSFPARLTDAFAVGAIGVKDAFAPTSTHRLIGARESKADYFVPTFSNFAPGKVNGCAPGVAVVSTVCDSGYLAKSGTSMACPVVAAHAARLLASNPDIRKLTGRKKVEELTKLLYNGSHKHDLDSEYVGMGVPSSD
jgi:subtilisin